jgi:hypothetical protein
MKKVHIFYSIYIFIIFCNSNHVVIVEVVKRKSKQSCRRLIKILEESESPDLTIVPITCIQFTYTNLHNVSFLPIQTYLFNKLNRFF